MGTGYYRIKFRASWGYAILTHMEWIEAIRARGLLGPLRLALDALEPLGPVGAQLLWVAQPVAGIIGGREIVGKLARTLEDPDEFAQLRRLLDDIPD